MKKETILIVDDQPEILNALERILKEEHHILTAASGAAALDILQQQAVAVILADQRMPGMTGVEFLSQAITQQPDTIRILITAYADITASIDAVNRGKIYYYISKPWEPEELLLIIRQAVDKYRLQRENKELNQKLQDANQRLAQENILLKQNIKKEYDFSTIIGHSPRMLQVFKLVSRIIDTTTTVLLLGETGTGKELIARAIHFNGPRKNELFVAQNCGALPDTLLESELFGHIRGSFTGAFADRKGIFEVADGGTVFLDEIADTSPALQVRLLRVLQEGEIKPVGGNKTIKVNVRVIAATNKNLDLLVREHKFREDLFYRLNVFPIVLPQLHERSEDISDLVQHFMLKYARKTGKNIDTITPQALQLLLQAHYPGNIRELENEIERAVTLADNNTAITPEILSTRFHQPPMPTPSDQDTVHHTLKNQVETLEKQMIVQALQETQGNILQAAEKLHLSRAGLHKKINRYKITTKSK
jgi:two-component system, NtrC family, response regulator HupR/HoxA